jgi:hypothetical protein
MLLTRRGSKRHEFTPLPSPIFNILVKVGYHNIPQCNVCIESILLQTYRKCNIIIGYDDERTLQYI